MKHTIEIGYHKAKNTTGNTLTIDGTIVGGYQSGFGYSLIEKFDIDIEKLEQIIKQKKQ